MSDLASKPEASFEPFVTVQIGHFRAPYTSFTTQKIALTSNAPGVTAIHWYDAASARRLAFDLNAYADVLDPKPIATEPVAPPKARKKRRPKKVVAKKKARK